MQSHEDVSWIPNQAQIVKIMPGVLERIRGNGHMRWYLGNGKDGTVFRLFNPGDDADRSFDRFALKEWHTEFLNRSAEVDLQSIAASCGSRAFRVPRIAHIDLKNGVFVMERVPGLDAFKVLYRNHRLLSEEMFEQIREAFRELNAHGIVHGDAHQGNYMFTDPKIDEIGGNKVLTDAQIWIIDFGHSRKGKSGNDLDMIERSLRGRIHKTG